MKIEFRRADVSDAPYIFELEKKTFSDAWSLESIRDTLLSESSACCVAVSDGEIASYILGNKISPEGEIYRVATRDDMRRLGIARKLLSYLFEKEGELGITDLYLEVREGNISAINLYTGCGFEQISLRKGYYKNPSENAVIMHRSIK